MNNKVIPYIIVFILLSVSSISTAQQKTSMLLQAEKTLMEGDTVSAIHHFRQVLVRYPQSYAASMRLAEVYYDQQDYQTAVQYCNIALDITHYFQDKALERLQPSNNISEAAAEEELEKIEQYKANRADILHLKGLIRARQLRRDDAVEAFKNALEITIDTKIMTDLALTYLETGHIYDALGLLHQTKILDSANYKTYYNLANVHYKVQHLDSALYYYRLTQEKAPKLKWPYLYSGHILTKKQQYEEAIKQYTHFIMLDSTHEEAFFRRAVLFSELREWQKALNDWRTVLDINPANVDAWRNKGLSHFQYGQYDSAIQAFNKALQLQPDEAYTYINRGYSYYLTNHPEQALADLDKGLAGLPKYYLGYYFRALVHLQMKRRKKACQDVKTAIKLGMKSAEIDKKLVKRCF